MIWDRVKRQKSGINQKPSHLLLIIQHVIYHLIYDQNKKNHLRVPRSWTNHPWTFV
jgi:hypothetical protein